MQPKTKAAVFCSLVLLAGLDCGGRSIPEARVEVVLEKAFDAPVTRVVFGRDTVKEPTRYYPRIVVVEKPGAAGPGCVALFLKPDGNVSRTLNIPAGAVLEASEAGNFLLVYGNHPGAGLELFAGDGQEIWQCRPFKERAGGKPVFHVSAKDGSVLALNARDDMLFLPAGGTLPGPAKLRTMYDDFELLGFSRDWQYMVARVNKSVTGQLGNRMISPQLAYLDSNFIVRWERPLGKYEGSTAGISAAGSYVYVSYAPSDTAADKEVASLGYIYDHYKDRVMMIEHAGPFRAFSRNERYLLADYRPRTGERAMMMLVDIEAKKILYRRNASGRNFLAADDGSVAAFDGQETTAQAFARDGKPLFQSADRRFAGGASELLGWDGENFILAAGDRRAGKVVVYRLTPAPR